MSMIQTSLECFIDSTLISGIDTCLHVQMREGVATGCCLGLVIKSSTGVTSKHVTSFLWPGVEKQNAS